jgi:hypothetical protein
MLRMLDQSKIYQRIGEFVVFFQWIENRLREIGWFILDPPTNNWPPRGLRDLTTKRLFDEVEKLFLDALPLCRLTPELEADFRASFAEYAPRFHKLRQIRNTILHSAYIELKAGGEVQALMRSNPKFGIDEETGKPLFDQEKLSEKSFEFEFKEMAELALFFNRCHLQLVHRYPRQ